MTGAPEAATSGTGPERVTEADLRARLAARGISLRPEEVAPVLATARFLAGAADLVRAASESAPGSASLLAAP